MTSQFASSVKRTNSWALKLVRLLSASKRRTDKTEQLSVRKRDEVDELEYTNKNVRVCASGDVIP